MPVSKLPRVQQQRRRCFSFEQLETRLAMATLYVDDVSGNDTSNGSSATPWLTLQKAADSVAAGDTVVVRAGTYAGFDLRTSGTAATPIQFLAESGVQIISPNNRTNRDGINVEEANYIVIDGFEVNNMPRAGIRSAVNHHVTIRNNRADGNGSWGIFTGFSDDLLIENNRCSNSIAEHGIYVSNSGDRPVIRNNVCYSNYGNGIHMNGDFFAGGDGIISNALVENNTIYDNGRRGGSGINCDGVQNSRIQNNLLYGNHASGISLYKIDGAAGSSGNVVVNNTVVQASDGRWALNVRDASVNNTVLNNIFYNNHPFRGSIAVSEDSLPGLVSDYNVLMNRMSRDGDETIISLSQWQTAGGHDLHSVLSTPVQLFVDAVMNDYRLSPNSPALNIGTLLLAPNYDRTGQPRPSGTGIDIGAFETQVATAPPIQLTATPTAANRIHLTWVDNVAAETGFRIERSTAGGNFTTAATLAAGSTSFDDLQLQSSLAYGYRVVSLTAGGDGTSSNIASAATPQLSTITGTSTADTYHVMRVGNQLHVYENTTPTGAPTYSSELAALSPTVTFDTLAGDDILNVNANGQTAIGVGRIVYSSGSGINSLNLQQGAATIDSTTTGVLNTTVGNGHLTTTQLRQNSLTIGNGGRVTLPPSGSTATLSSLTFLTPALVGNVQSIQTQSERTALSPSYAAVAPLRHDVWLAMHNAVWAEWNEAAADMPSMRFSHASRRVRAVR